VLGVVLALSLATSSLLKCPQSQSPYGHGYYAVAIGLGEFGNLDTLGIVIDGYCKDDPDHCVIIRAGMYDALADKGMALKC
jgi:hypothetical protein